MTNAMTLQLACSVSLQAVSACRQCQSADAMNAFVRGLSQRLIPTMLTMPMTANARRYARERATGDARINAACV